MDIAILLLALFGFILFVTYGYLGDIMQFQYVLLEAVKLYAILVVVVGFFGIAMAAFLHMAAVGM